MSALKRKSLRSVATVAIALTAILGSSSHAEAALLGPSSNYIVKITPEARATVESAIKKAGGRIDGQFKYAFDGFVINLPDMLIPLLKKIPNILTVEKDLPISGLAIQSIQTPTTSWGLDRTDQREVVSTAAGYQGTYGYRSAGRGATIYIGDTGIYPHEDLAGRISTSGFSGISDGNGTVDCNGHGTHVATTAAGTQYGIAKNATVVPVRILGCGGFGSFSTVIAGLDWILSPLNPNSKSQAVLNLSIGGNASTSVNDAILRLTNAGITVVAAAGNESTDACTRSPASAPSAITVGATTIVDARASFSNFGTCVDIFAPGAGITGGWIGSPSATVTVSGTSMASPHVAGAAAVYLGLNPTASVAQVSDALKAEATKGAVTNIDANTVNNLLYLSPTDGGPAVSNPAVLISTITGITHLQAEASVEINPNNAPTTASIEYATDSAFTSIVKRINLTPTALVGGDVITLPVIFDGLQPSTRYYFRASATNESGTFTTPAGEFKSIAAPVTAPTPVAKDATSVTGWSARLNGTVNANNGSTTVSFVYGTDPEFLVNTQTGLASPQTVSGSAVTTVGLDISFLNGSTKYYYKVVASNSAASATSEVLSFTTPEVTGVKAFVETIRPSKGLDTPATTVTGRVNPNGQTTSVKLVYGSDSALINGNKVVEIATKYTGIETVTVSADMTALVPGVRYYYRFEATNAAGVTKPLPLTNVGNPVMPVVNKTYGSGQTQTGVTLNANINGGAGNIRLYFIYGSDPKLETGTVTAQATPFAITNGNNNVVTLPLTGLKPDQIVYFRVKIFAYTGPLTEVGGTLLGPIASIQTLAPTKIAQSISFTLPTSRYYGGAPTLLTATATSGLPITYSTTTPAVCKVVEVDGKAAVTHVTPVPAGSGSACNLVASQPGDSTYSAATSIGKTINFMKESSKITATWSAPITQAGSTLSIKVASSTQPLLNENQGGTSAVVITTTTPKVCAISDTQFVGALETHTTTTIKGIWNGTCQLAISFPGFGYWQASSTSLISTVSGMTTPQPGANAAQIINFTLPSQRFYGGAGTVLSGSATSGLALSYTTSTPSVCSIDLVETSTVLNFVSPIAGNSTSMCTVTATQAGDDRFAAALPVQRSMTWAKENTALKATWAGAVTVAGTEIGVVVSSASQPLLKESNAGSTPLTFTSKTPKVCTVESPTYVGTSTTHTKATVKALFNGICQIESSFAGNSYWLPVTSIASITISGITTPQPGASAPQAINFSQPANTPADKSVALTATATSGLAVTIASLTPAVCAVTQDANGKYSAAAVSGLSGDLNNCQLQATQAGDTRWAAAPAVVKSFRFVRVAQTISFTAPTSRFFGGPLTQLVATSTSGLPVTFTSKTPAICSVAAGETTSVLAYVTPLTTSSSATCAIEASQAGDNTYAPATNINRFVSLRKESTTIKATWAGPISVDGTNLDLLVTSTSQPSLNEKVADVAALVVTSRTPGICKVENAQYLGTDSVHTRVVVKAMWNGTCSLTAAYAGHTYWLASSQSISTSITKMTTPQPGANAAQMISMSMPTTIGIAQTAILAPSATSKLKVELTTTTPAVCVVIATTASYTVKAAPGVVGNGNICTLQATQAGNESWAAAPTFTRNLTINKANMAIRLSRWSSGITGKTPALFTAGVAYVDGPSNGGLNSIGHLLTISTSTPGVCSVTDVGPSATTTGTFTQATITGITNGTCAVTLKFAATDTQNEIVLLRNITISGIK